MGLLIPGEYNGEDMGFLDMSVLLEEMGYACLSGPFFSTAVLAEDIFARGFVPHRPSTRRSSHLGEIKISGNQERSEFMSEN